MNPKSEHRVPVRIHLLWAGPHTFGDVLGMKDLGDYGIYQVCGPHPASAAESLQYIGQANGQTFGERFTDPDRQEWCPDDVATGAANTSSSASTESLSGCANIVDFLVRAGLHADQSNR
ncbi:MAG: hypothetical protein F4110_07855 [Acidimicrobiaceae bacterium]|nr:hypothetical protein [Acidimicrobiaceae bacterium]MXZ99091.1 hypothetical protein [Acidimicrobiaceae bacterium]MYE77192.1 hypothetical protein [Acidimicrobiaceae bacterium]MYE96104.1 hypothetical protein [Acidimicrobiaceae bacterium]MYH43923.1 hypothetical protein [Acidimicrobiaceae bacterium]